MSALHTEVWTHAMRDALTKAIAWAGDYPSDMRATGVWAEDNAGVLEDLLASLNKALADDSEMEREAA